MKTYIQLPVAGAVFVAVAGFVGLPALIIWRLPPASLTLLCGLWSGLAVGVVLAVVVLASGRRRAQATERQQQIIVLLPDRTQGIVAERRAYHEHLR